MGNYILTAGIRIAKDFVPGEFGRLVPIGPAFKIKDTLWQVFECKCGAVIAARSKDVRRLFKRSCGCYYSDTRQGILKTHGKTGTAEHRIWKGMVSRCHNKNVHNYKDYGGRGIYVCDRWRITGGGFMAFLTDMGERPSDEHSIDRIDNNGPYSPDNCRWADKETQVNNKQDSRKIEHNGQVKTLAQWAKVIGLTRKSIALRLDRGWSISDALTIPKQRSRRKT